MGKGFQHIVTSNCVTYSRCRLRPVVPITSTIKRLVFTFFVRVLETVDLWFIWSFKYIITDDRHQREFCGFKHSLQKKTKKHVLENGNGISSIWLFSPALAPARPHPQADLPHSTSPSRITPRPPPYLTRNRMPPVVFANLGKID